MVQEGSWWEKNRVTGLYQLGLDVDKILGQASAHQKKRIMHYLKVRKQFHAPENCPPPPASPSSLARRARSICRAHAVEQKGQLGVVRLKMS